MHNKKLVWDKICQGMSDGGYSRSAQRCRVKVNNLKQKYRKIPKNNKTSGNQRQEWEIFEFNLGTVLLTIERHFVFNFRLRVYPA